VRTNGSSIGPKFVRDLGEEGYHEENSASCFCVRPHDPHLPRLFRLPLFSASFLTVLPPACNWATDRLRSGWSFDLTAPTTITGLAVFHDNGVGLLENHTVGIWNAARALQVTGTVIPADPCVLDQGGLQEWCTVAVRPITLPAGTYTIGATWNNLLDPMIFPGTLAAQGLANLNGPNVVPHRSAGTRHTGFAWAAVCWEQWESCVVSSTRNHIAIQQGPCIRPVFFCVFYQRRHPKRGRDAT